MKIAIMPLLYMTSTNTSNANDHGLCAEQRQRGYSQQIDQVQNSQVARSVALDRLSVLTSVAEILLHLDKADVIG